LKRLSIPILCAVFFCSGAAALVFESLWFRQAGLAFGNSVWASALVLSSFMAGLAVGNTIVVRTAGRIRRPVRVYALLEATIALTGAPLVFLLPELGRWLDPLLGAAIEKPWLLNALRLGVSFGVLLVPATAMGATLPILVKALSERDRNFGSVLGRLYGYNTMGAVVGALAAEVVLVPTLGVRGAALAASGLYVAAALVALAIQRSLAAAPAPEPARVAPVVSEGAARTTWRAAPLAASSFVAGWVLLAFEVVWFRLLRLFVEPNPLAFSVLLAVVLSGIGLGGFLAGRILARSPHADRHGAALACLAGATAVGLYAGFQWVLAPYGTGYILHVADLLWLSTALMLPVSLLSGALFTFTGTALEREVPSGVRAAGLLSLANTVGGMLGSLAGAFLLLPLLGIERSFFLLASLYGLVGLLLLSARSLGPAALRNGLRGVAALALVAALLAFPFGLMRDGYLAIAATRFGYPTISSIAALREGLMETVMILRTEQRMEPAYHRLVTGGFSMASNQVLDRRYMKLFVYWALALNPNARSALLISYGMGSTAEALSDSAGLARIDVVDISRDILEVSEVVFPDPAEHPLRDPRVEVVVEDGRYFLETTARRYDLITSEPPPPKHAGVVNLYTREYFQLIHDRLADGGINTYWLPVHLLPFEDTKAIIRGYCDAFPNCSLWGGIGYSWMLAGIRAPVPAVTEEAFSRQWRDAEVATELRTLGLELPEQLAALFMLDAKGLDRLTRGVPPLTDDRPNRLSNAVPTQADFSAHFALMNPWEASRAFRESEFASQILPEAIRERAPPYFEFQDLLERGIVLAGGPRPLEERLARVHRIQTASPLRTLALWNLGSLGDDGRGFRPLKRAEQALADRDFTRAVSLYFAAWKLAPRDREIPVKLFYASCMSGSLASLGVAPSRCGKLPRLLVRP
jgi:spermidine synthase